MRRQAKGYLVSSLFLFVVFCILTVLVAKVDVQPIGPQGTDVGMASLNQMLRFEFNERWYRVSELLGYMAVGTGLCFALVGLYQLITRRSILKVNFRILLLGGLYILMAGFYILFEKLEINFRPVILDQGLEASYPSSHIVLSVCTLQSLTIPVNYLLKDDLLLRYLITGAAEVATGILVLSRILSGVHWMTDIIGGLLLAISLVLLYMALVKQFEPRRKHSSHHSSHSLGL